MRSLCLPLAASHYLIEAGKENHQEAGEMGQQLRTHAALVKDLSLASSTRSQKEEQVTDSCILYPQLERI